MGFRVKNLRSKKWKLVKVVFSRMLRSSGKWQLTAKGTEVKWQMSRFGIMNQGLCPKQALKHPCLYRSVGTESSCGLHGRCTSKGRKAKGTRLHPAAFETCEADPWMGNGGRTWRSLDHEAHPPLSHREKELMVLKQQGPEEKHIE